MELIAEIGPANGDLDYAFAAVDAAHRSGFDWVKAQIYDRDRLTTRTAATYAQPGVKVAATQYEDFENQLSYSQWAAVKEYADSIGIGWFASVFDFDAVEFCESLGVERYKIASGDITHKPLIELAASTGKPVILSTGAATEHEIRRAVGWAAPNLSVLACTLSYPTAVEDANLARMESLRSIWPHVGYSDHTFGTGAIIRARFLKAELVEKHFTVSPGEGGDHDFAVTPAQMEGLQLSGAGLKSYDGDGVLEPLESELKARVGARRSCYAKHDLAQGSILFPDDVSFLRPGVGMEPWSIAEFYGSPLRSDVPGGVPFHPTMF